MNPITYLNKLSASVGENGGVFKYESVGGIKCTTNIKREWEREGERERDRERA